MFRVKFQSFSSTHIMWNCFNDCVEPDATSRLEQRKWNRIRSFQISTKEPITIAKDSNLILDQNLHQTNEGIVINNGKINLSNIKSFIENHSTDKNALRLITNTEINKVTQNFYITSFAGLRLKTIKLLRIDLILNATIDLPSIDLSRDDGMETKILRVPISEKEPETLNRYIDNVADQIHYNYSLNKNTLLYCHDGSFNTIALAIGYLLKYTDLFLSETLLYLHSIRKNFQSPSLGSLGNFKSILINFANRFDKNDITRKIRKEINNKTL